MRRVISLWLPRFATDRWQRQQTRDRQARDRQARDQQAGNRQAGDRQAWNRQPQAGCAKLDNDTPADNPAPLALITRARGQLRLTAVNRTAEIAGLAPGLPLASARALLPDLITAEAEPLADAEALAHLAAWASRYTPWVGLEGGLPEAGQVKAGPVKTGPVKAGSADQGESLNGGGAGLFLDVTGCAHLFAGTPEEAEAALLTDLMRRIEGLGFAARAGLAETPGAAWGLARFATTARRPWRRLPAGQTRAALAPLPPAALRLPGDILELLERLGLRRIDALYALPRVSLESRFGPLLARRLAEALGEITEPITPLAPPPRHLVRRLYGEAIAARETIARGLESLLLELCRQLEKEQLGARRLLATAYRVDGSLARLTVGTSRPNREPAHLARLLAEQLDQLDPGFGIEAMSLAALNCQPLTALQLSLAEEEARGDRNDVDALIDRLGGRFGFARIHTLKPQESHIPERAVLKVSPGQPTKPPATVQPSTAQPSTAWRRNRPRPLRLLSHPEPVEAIALLPDYPPQRFRWRHQLFTVARAEGPERLTAEWWREEASQAQAPLRDYFRLEDQAGRRYWLYRSEGRWFMQGFFA